MQSRERKQRAGSLRNTRQFRTGRWAVVIARVLRALAAEIGVVAGNSPAAPRHALPRVLNVIPAHPMLLLSDHVWVIAGPGMC